MDMDPRYAIFSHPDFTVGTGISPVRHDPSVMFAGFHRRYGISPIPKDLHSCIGPVLEISPENITFSGLKLNAT